MRGGLRRGARILLAVRPQNGSAPRRQPSQVPPHSRRACKLIADAGPRPNTVFGRLHGQLATAAFRPSRVIRARRACSEADTQVAGCPNKHPQSKVELLPSVSFPQARRPHPESGPARPSERARSLARAAPARVCGVNRAIGQGRQVLSAWALRLRVYSRLR